MAYYAALVSLVQVLEDILHRDRYQNLLLHKQQIASVYEKFSHLHTLLGDYSPEDREAADFLERRIRDVAYQALDIIEYEISNRMHQYLSKRNQMPQQLQELEKVKEEVDSIAEELKRINESHTPKDLVLSSNSADAGTSDQACCTNTMEGVEERLTKIKDQLCGEPSKLRVVSIVGMGGIGKTTLARNIFDDGLIAYKFDYRAWVTISQDYHLQKVLLDIIHSMNVPASKSSGLGELGEKIYKHLKGRRYLIIMDDMWDTKVWDDMRRILPDDSNGSRILITTRISNVASYANTSGFFHQMQFFNMDQSLNLFWEKVFCPPELEDIGRLIAKNCRGLPLAIVVVAGLLAKVNRTQRDWKEIARNVSATAAENDEHFSKILSLSYNHLPHHLKPCLLHIGGFPEDYEIHVSTLVKLWIAEGFIKPIESKSLETTAEEYLEDLVNRNLVLITKKRPNGKIKCCGIHDLLRDLCIQNISYEDFDQHKELTASRSVRRLYIRRFSSPQLQQRIAEECGIKLLRVLDATKSFESFTFWAKILELFHLRYLAIRLDVFDVPPSISLLQNLQTLIFNYHANRIGFCSLPSQIREMPNIRHIMSSSNLCFKCQFFDEKSVGKPSILENMQTLSRVDVKFTNEVIEMIPNLQKLKVFYFEEEAAEWQKFRLDNLILFRQLETLSIYFHVTWKNAAPLPESFAFPFTLKKLSLESCRLSWKDMRVVGSLPNLQVLKLRWESFEGETWEPVEGEFPQLKFLLLETLKLKYWLAENTHFPTLQHLKISCCEELQEIPPEIGEISTLQLVEVESMLHGYGYGTGTRYRYGYGIRQFSKF